MICVSIGRTRHKMIVLEHRALADRGAELVELRLDWLSRIPDLGRLIDNRPTPVIITCRRRTDGGRWRGTEEQRMTILRSAIVAGVDYVDIEEDVARSVPRYGKTKRIISYHNFEETPPDIEQIHARICRMDPDIVKIVTLANSPGDAAKMLEISKKSSIPTIGFCMGEIGLFSRILCGRFGSPI
ncbi:MAG: type I 3-dehydroquinate dehydratase, partial [Rhodopirellula sp.]|nr:type I 3-dehydroquinate dehydratase [Rhodopirellula sp.]